MSSFAICHQTVGARPITYASNLENCAELKETVLLSFQRSYIKLHRVKLILIVVMTLKSYNDVY